MNTGRPLILMALANDDQNSLRFLQTEAKEVGNVLRSAHSNEQIEFLLMIGTTLVDIYQEINRSHRKLFIFHYSGHSNSKGLALEDTLVKKESLGTLLGKLPNLKLIFLNGCANLEQVKVLHNSGVRAVIATSAPIEDRKAQIFAHIFYQGMAGGQTIQEAFDKAASFVKNDHENLSIESVKVEKTARGIKLDSIQKEAFPWGLYYQETSDVSWHIPLPEQLDETIAKDITSIDSANFQLDETIVQPTTSIGTAEVGVHAVEIETNDRRVQDMNGVIRIKTGSIRFGRAPKPECDIVILDLDRHVSRRHAHIYRQGEEMILVDTSKNGTFWRSKGDTSGSKTSITRMPLSEDGSLWLGEVEFTIRVIK